MSCAGALSVCGAEAVFEAISWLLTMVLTCLKALNHDSSARRMVALHVANLPTSVLADRCPACVPLHGLSTVCSYLDVCHVLCFVDGKKLSI